MRLILTFGLVLIFPAFTFAQGGAAPQVENLKQQGKTYSSLQAGSGGWGYNNYQQQIMTFLLNPTYQKELELSDEQKQKVRDLQKKLSDGYKEIYNNYPELKDQKLDYKKRSEIYKKLQNDYTLLRKKVEDEVVEQLVPNQKTVLTKLQFNYAMKYYGVSATLTRTPFAEQIKTTDTQKTELLKIKKDIEAEIQKLIEEKRKEGKEKMLKILDASQRKKIKELEGDTKKTGFTRL